MKGLLVALQFMTRLPGPRLTVSDDEFARSMRWFPVVGLFVGAPVAGAAWAGALVDPWTGALAGLLVWTGVTGALHLDGLGDVADAAGASHKDRARMLAAMSDPHVGSFAVVTIALQCLAKLVLLHGLVERQTFAPLILIPFAARTGPLVWTLWLQPLHQGLGARFRHAIGGAHIILWGVLLALCSALAPGLAVTPVLILLWGLWLRARLGGISGDGHGAGIELVESVLLLACLIGVSLS